MARWVAFGEMELGRLEANDREGAERVARRLYGHQLVRVQSVLSLEAARAEGHRVEDDEPDDVWPRL